MLRKIIAVITLWCVLAGLPGSTPVQAAPADLLVYVVPLEGAVEKGLHRYLDRAFKEAEQSKASAIVLELNTPGGLIDAASDIRDLIFDSPLPVFAYVRYSAISAGAFIALSCRALYMAPGSSIGAAEPRNMAGTAENVDEKILSYWESQMRTVAETQGKDPQVAAAMVRREISIEGVVSDRELLTLTAKEALAIGFTDGIVASRSELLDKLGYAGARVVQVETRSAERMARFITNPVVATALVTVGLAALVIEVLTAGFGLAGIISILAFSLFFGGHIFAGLAGREVIFLFLLGVILLLVEAFIPNFGVVGLSGLGAIVASVVMSAATTGQGVWILVVSLLLASLIVAVSYRYLKRSGLWSQIILQFAETKDQGYVGPGDAAHLLGKSGITLTPLRPAGVVEIDGKRVDVVSEGGFIALSTEVRVVATEGSRIVVRPL